MDEKQYIYQRLHFLGEQVEFLTKSLEKQSELIGSLTAIIEKMQSPEYARMQAKTSEMADVAEKIAFIRNLTRKE
jgi:hypothetical protein